MQIKTDIRTINGEHNGVPFALEGGLLTIAGHRYSKAEIKALVQIANLLEIEGFKLAESIPIVNRRGNKQFRHYFGLDWAQEWPDELEGGQ